MHGFGHGVDEFMDILIVVAPVRKDAAWCRESAAKSALVVMLSCALQRPRSTIHLPSGAE